MSVESGLEKDPLPRATTENFQQFQKYQEEENRRNHAWDSYDNLLVKYIIQYKESPFLEDDDLEEARKTLRANGIYKEII